MDTSDIPKEHPTVMDMDWLNYHHLRYFWTVAREGSLARASQTLHISQPAISEQIRELEAALGEKLFRRSGRQNVLTEAGLVAYRYADEVFAIGRELTHAVRQQPTTRPLRFAIGVADSFPKLVASEILKPVLAMPRTTHLVCREGKLEDLLGQLAAHRLDLVLADEPPSSSVNFKVFHQPLGETSIVFCAEKRLAGQLRRRFPESLHEAPAFLPAENTALRRALEAWFREKGIRPRVLAEFDDLALMKVMAIQGRGFIAVPAVILQHAAEHYGFRTIGEATGCRIEFLGITAERRIAHPAVEVITGHGLAGSR